MNSSDIDNVLDHLFGLASQDTPADLSLVRARLASALDKSPAGAGGNLSIARLVSDGDDDRAQLVDAMMASPELFLEASDALGFLADVEANLVKAPSDLDEPAQNGALGVEQIHALFRDGTQLTTEQQRQLFTDPVLRTAFAKIKQDYALARPSEAPTTGQTSSQMFVVSALAAAASDHKVIEREFPGGRLRIVKASRGNDMLISFWLDPEGPRPTALMFEGTDGSIAYTPLPTPDPDGRLLIIKDLDQLDHAEFIRLLQDPTSIGTFLK